MRSALKDVPEETLNHSGLEERQHFQSLQHLTESDRASPYHGELVQRQTTRVVAIYLAHEQVEDPVLHRNAEEVQNAIALLKAHRPVLVHVELVEHLIVRHEVEGQR